ncbi:hypothetical protein BN874_2990002 [Candidatus Contendobacter odensis Run_B_J11]|uniref:Uncharacterized protein n=1 Tax=Candidatus Contendobacter odensis Run_B_J11 TaxID=1400861 RepID=A0A7U7GCF0_9GAMM|nr:hypothetical protein BN874_2990002 [Candidatus Contendobacter odensis Run_B_J11]
MQRVGCYPLLESLEWNNQVRTRHPIENSDAGRVTPGVFLRASDPLDEGNPDPPDSPSARRVLGDRDRQRTITGR